MAQENILQKTEKAAEPAENLLDALTEITEKAEGQDTGEEEKKKGEKKDHSFAIYISKFVLKIVVIIAATWIFLNYVFGVFILRGNYMFPAVRDGDLCFTYRLEDYVIGDVVLYEHEGKHRIGRIVALQGMDVDISEEGELYVDGAIPAEQIFYLTDKGTTKYPCTVGEGEVFIINDFRSDTDDGRTYGPTKIKDLEGKCIFVLRRRGF